MKKKLQDGTTNRWYFPWEKDTPIGVFMDEPKLDKEKLCYWLYWLRGQAKEAKIWSGANDEIAYRQVRELIEKRGK